MRFTSGKKTYFAFTMFVQVVENIACAHPEAASVVEMFGDSIIGMDFNDAYYFYGCDEIY